MNRFSSLSYVAAATALVVVLALVLVPGPLKNSDLRGRARGRKESGFVQALISSIPPLTPET